MDKIIFNNVLRGFPADEKFMRMVDYNRLALLDICNGILGNDPVILKGAEISQRAEGGRLRIMVSSGILWTGNDLVKIKQSQVFTTQPEGVYIKIVTTAEKGTFHDGAEYDAYERSEGILASPEDGEPPAADKTIYLHRLRRVNICQSVSSNINLADLSHTGLKIKGSLQQTVYSDGRVNIRGIVAALDFNHRDLSSLVGTRVARLPIRNADIDSKISSKGNRAGNVYPAAITLETNQSYSDEGLVSFSHFVKMTNDGELYIHIPYNKIDLSFAGNEKIWDVYISVDFTYNSRK